MSIINFVKFSAASGQPIGPGGVSAGDPALEANRVAWAEKLGGVQEVQPVAPQEETQVLTPVVIDQMEQPAVDEDAPVSEPFFNDALAKDFPILRKKCACLEDVVELGEKLSEYAAASGKSNTPEYMDGLYALIRKYQYEYKLIKLAAGVDESPLDADTENPTEEITGSAVPAYAEEIVRSTRERVQLSGKYTPESFLTDPKECEAAQWLKAAHHALQAARQALQVPVQSDGIVLQKDLEATKQHQREIDNARAKVAYLLQELGWREMSKPLDTGDTAGNHAVTRAAMAVYLRDRSKKN